jgi:hypothetical protein
VPEVDAPDIGQMVDSPLGQVANVALQAQVMCMSVGGTSNAPAASPCIFGSPASVTEPSGV